MYNTTECFQDPHGPPKAETQLFPSTAERTTQIWGVCVWGGGPGPPSLSRSPIKATLLAELEQWLCELFPAEPC